MPARRLFLLVGLSAAVLATDAAAATPGDPFEKLNRRVFEGSDRLAKRFLHPLANAYRALTPGPIGIGLHNFFVWLSEPAVVVNDVLQVRVQHAAKDLARLVTNTTFAGFVDIAAKQGLPHHDNDFGVTLGRWGVRPGPYLFLPLLGPTTVRDAIGTGADAAMAPLNYIRFPGRLTLQYATTAVGGVDKLASSEGDLEAATSSAADPYATLRSLYLQSREAAVADQPGTITLPPLDSSNDTAQPPAPKADTAKSDAPKAEPTKQATSAEAAPAPSRAVRLVADDPDAPIATALPDSRAGAGFGA